MKKTTYLLILSVIGSTLSFAQTNSFDTVHVADLNQLFLDYSPFYENFESEINISGFPNDTITSGNQVRFIRMNLEHSSLDELEIWVECPNGSKVALINSMIDSLYEAIPGGYNGIEFGPGVFLGDPNTDGITGNQGIGWEYSFSSYYNTFDEIEVEKLNGNFVPASQMGNNGNSMNPNSVYLPYDSFDNFVGCPVEGTWKFLMADYVDFENGTFFGWGFDLDGFLSTPALNANKTSLEIYPNPAENVIRLKTNESFDGNYTILNELGNIVHSGAIANAETSIDITTLTSGIYFMRVDSQTLKFIKR